MADEPSVGRDLIAENFGLIIAYLLPGLLGLWTGYYASEGLAGWIKDAAKGNADLGSFLLLLLGALLYGLMLQALRWAIFEEGLRAWPWAVGRWPQLKRPDYDEAASMTAGAQVRLNEYRDQHYRYYQHYGGVFAGLPLVFATWLVFEQPARGTALFGLAAFLMVWALSFFTALDCLRRVRNKTAKLLGTRERAA